MKVKLLPFLFAATLVPRTTRSCSPSSSSIAFHHHFSSRRRSSGRSIGPSFRKEERQDTPYRRPVDELARATFATTTVRSMSAESSSSSKKIVVDPFCFRQFAEHEASKKYGGTIFSSITVSEIEDIVNERFTDDSMLKDGYAPFCKHIFLSNDFTKNDARVNVLEISKENEHLIRTEYVARNDQELPILQRYIPSSSLDDSIELPVAKCLDFILYSREQINKENESMGKKKDIAGETAPWGIVSIKAQDVDYELPMNPITIMRNALGKEHGGSGKPLSKEEYMASVNYWKDHVVIQ